MVDFFMILFSVLILKIFSSIFCMIQYNFWIFTYFHCILNMKAYWHQKQNSTLT